MKTAPVPRSIQDSFPAASKGKATPAQIKQLRILAGDQSAWDLPGRLSQRVDDALLAKGWTRSKGYGLGDEITPEGRQAAGI